ncbi:uncharacterized protein LOC124442867 isoform X2 [Xenia sp. Carnegie-2017]|nr:uncharacterized protein LOC124442867 isoform X2 [Xenia sp. Carnegie-2017]
MEKSLSPKDFKEFSQSILSQGKQPQCEATINQDVDVDSPVVDQSVIDILQASQASNSSGELDKELVEILMSLDKDDNETLLHECSHIAGSQKGSDDEHDEDIDEDKESILMSQPFWKDDEEGHDFQSSEDGEEMDWKPPSRMPQVDGPGDAEDSGGHGSTCTTVSRGFKDKNWKMKIEYDDDNDFQSKEKSKSKNLKKCKQGGRKRKIAQLNVFGGCHKTQNDVDTSTHISSRQMMTNDNKRRETMTPTSPFRGSKNNVNEEFPDFHSFYPSNKRGRSGESNSSGSKTNTMKNVKMMDKETVSNNFKKTSKGKKKMSGLKKGNEIFRNLGVSKNGRELLRCTENDSSGSQTSDFELWLSESSCDDHDDDDFKATFIKNFHKNKVFQGSFGTNEANECGKNNLKTRTKLMSKKSNVSSNECMETTSVSCKKNISDLFDPDSHGPSTTSTLGQESCLYGNSFTNNLKGTRKSEKSPCLQFTLNKTEKVVTKDDSSSCHDAVSLNKKSIDLNRNDVKRDVEVSSIVEKNPIQDVLQMDGKYRGDSITFQNENVCKNLVKSSGMNQISLCKDNAVQKYNENSQYCEKTEVTKTGNEDNAIAKKHSGYNDDFKEKKKRERPKKKCTKAKVIDCRSEVNDNKKRRDCDLRNNKMRNKRNSPRVLMDACVRLEKISVEDLKFKTSSKIVEHPKDVVNCGKNKNDEDLELKDMEDFIHMKDKFTSLQSYEKNTLVEKNHSGYGNTPSFSSFLQNASADSINVSCKECMIDVDKHELQRIEKSFDEPDFIEDNITLNDKVDKSCGKLRDFQITFIDESNVFLSCGDIVNKDFINSLETKTTKDHRVHSISSVLESLNTDNDNGFNDFVVEDCSRNVELDFEDDLFALTPNQTEKNFDQYLEHVDHRSVCSESKSENLIDSPSESLCLTDEKHPLYSHYSDGCSSGSSMVLRLPPDEESFEWNLDESFDGHQSSGTSNNLGSPDSSTVPVVTEVRDLNLERTGECFSKNNVIKGEEVVCDVSNMEISRDLHNKEHIKGAFVGNDIFYEMSVDNNDCDQVSVDKDGFDQVSVNNDGCNEVYVDNDVHNQVYADNDGCNQVAVEYDGCRQVFEDSDGYNQLYVNKDSSYQVYKDQKESHSKIKNINTSQAEGSYELKIWRPTIMPPSPNYVKETRHIYNLPHVRHQKAFCRDSNDLPLTTKVVGGRRLHLSSLSVKELPEFNLGGNFRTLRELQDQCVSKMDNGLLMDCLASEGKISNFPQYKDIPGKLKIVLMGDRDVIITPVKLPPTRKDVEKWMLTKRPGSERLNTSDIVSEDCEIPKIANFVNGETFVTEHKLLESSGGQSLQENNEESQGNSGNIPSCHVIGPKHSTPVVDCENKSHKVWHCTPIDHVKDKNNEESRKEKDLKLQNLRRNLLKNHEKDYPLPGAHQQTSLSEGSYIEGPTPTNSFGFQISQPNIQDAKSLRQVQFLTLLSVELHVRTRRSLRPDPEFDVICAIFYHIENETKDGKKYETGVIVTLREMTKIRNTNDDVCQSTSATDTTKTSHVKGTLQRHFCNSNNLEVVTVEEETDVINHLVKIVHEKDPDILLGFEVQMLSWGYLIQRATTLGIDIASQLSRVQDTSGTARFDAEIDKWGANHTSEITITGRIILNVWRLMKHEVTLNVYSFENVSYHVLHERVPLYSYRQLTQWWDKKLPHDRWRTVEHYVIRCQGNIRILNQLDFINRTSEFARLYGILFYSVISRGSQFRVESMMFRLTKPMNYISVSPSIQQRARMDAPECIPLVMEPESRFYVDPVIVLDFQSLYPSMIIAYNYCYSTCLGKLARLNKIGHFEFGCTSLNVPPTLLEKLQDDIHVSANGSVFVKSNIRRGILPRMLEEILYTRIMVKKALKDCKDDKTLLQLLDARQLALKLIANVTYGYTSANFSGRMPCVEIADAIVRKARETLERAINLVNTRDEWGGRVVYGDTDSLFVLVKGASKEEAFKIGKEIVDAVTAENPKPVKLKFEKVYMPCVLQTKKRYVGYMYETLEQKDPVFDAKGIETVRRDTCPAVAKILEKSLRILFEERDVSLVKKFVQRQFVKMMKDRVSIQDFIFAKEYRGMKRYKPKACVPALEIARRHLSRDRRAEPRVGERVPYVIVNGSPGLPLIQLVKDPIDVLNDKNLRLNTIYYVQKQILPPLDRVFSLIGVDVFSWYTQLPRYIPRHRVIARKQKRSISRFFTTLHCPVCEQLTQHGLCQSCRSNPQKSVFILASRVGNWERKYSHLKEICFQCCGARDEQLSCISLDCPVMFKLEKLKTNMEYGMTLRDFQKTIEESYGQSEVNNITTKR